MTTSRQVVAARGVDDVADAGALDAVASRLLTKTPLDEGNLISLARSPIATPAQVADEPPPFPSKTAACPIETFYPDWRQRLTRNLSRRSDSRWDPLTRVHAENDILNSTRPDNAITPVR